MLQNISSYPTNYNLIIKTRGNQACLCSKKCLKLKLEVFLAGHNIAMVTCYLKRLTTTCLPLIGNLYDTIIVAPLVKQ